MDKSATTRLRIFVSYSRRDSEFVDWLSAALEGGGYDVRRDLDDILPTEKWRQRLKSLIAGTDLFLFVLSPGSVASPACEWEVSIAQSLNKRMAPVLLHPLEDKLPPEALAELNWVDFQNASSRDASLTKLTSAIGADIDWVREHTRLAEAGYRWSTRGTLTSEGLLSEHELAAALQWLRRVPPSGPKPTKLHYQFIQASKALYERRKMIQNARFFTILGLLGVIAFSYISRDSIADTRRLLSEALLGWASAEERTGDMLADRSDRGGAVEAYLASSRARQTLAEQSIGGDEPHLHLAKLFGQIGQKLASQGEQKAAVEAYQRGTDVLRRISSSPQSPLKPQYDDQRKWFEARIAEATR